MKYSEIIEPRHRQDRFQDTYPVLAIISVRPIRWEEFQRYVNGSDVAKLISHELVNRRVIARVACLDDEIAERMDDGDWA